MFENHGIITSNRDVLLIPYDLCHHLVMQVHFHFCNGGKRWFTNSSNFWHLHPIDLAEECVHVEQNSLCHQDHLAKILLCMQSVCRSLTMPSHCSNFTFSKTLCCEMCFSKLSND
jgi:hypothetical protein